jgi:hypothetical protein
MSALHVIPIRSAAEPRPPEYVYEIVRQDASVGPMPIGATGMTVLQPGDLVRVTSTLVTEPTSNLAVSAQRAAALPNKARELVPQSAALSVVPMTAP